MTTEGHRSNEFDYADVERVEARIDNLRNVADRFDHPGGSRRLAQRARDKADGMETALRLLGVTERGVFGDPGFHHLLSCHACRVQACEVEGNTADRHICDVSSSPAPESCTQCEGGESRCLYYACGERQDDRHTRWWCEFGTCSRDHAVLHYGEEAI